MYITICQVFTLKVYTESYKAEFSLFLQSYYQNCNLLCRQMLMTILNQFMKITKVATLLNKTEMFVDQEGDHLYKGRKKSFKFTYFLVFSKKNIFLLTD